MNILYITGTKAPLFRVDETILFGKYLKDKGINSYLCTYCLDLDGKVGWPGGKSLVKHVKSSSRSRIVLEKYWHMINVLVKTDNNVDVIHVRDNPLMGLIALIFAKIRRKPFVFWMSYPSPEGALLSAKELGMEIGLFRLLVKLLKGHLLSIVQYRIVIPNSSHVFVQSDQMKLDLIRKGIRGDLMTPVPMGIEPYEYVNLEPSQSFDDEIGKSKIIVYIGALDRVRRVDFFIRVLHEVRNSFSGVKLLLIGDCNEDCDRKWLLEQIRKDGESENVVITGWLPRAQALTLLKKSDVGICALPDDPIFNSMSPTKAAEMMAVGLPVVVTDHPDQGKIVKDCNCGIVTKYDEYEMADAVKQILTNDELAKNMGGWGREYIMRKRSYSLLAEEVASDFFKLADGI